VLKKSLAQENYVIIISSGYNDAVSFYFLQEGLVSRMLVNASLSGHSMRPKDIHPHH